MPLEIRTLHIKATIDEKPTAKKEKVKKRVPHQNQHMDQATLIAQVIEAVADIQELKKER